MRNYVYLTTNRKQGLSGISRNTILHICNHVLKKLKEKYNLDPSIECGKFNLAIRYDNIAYVSFKLISKNIPTNIDLDSFTNDLEKMLTSSFASLCEGAQFKLNITHD